MGVEGSDGFHRPGDQSRLGLLRLHEVAPGMAPALGMHHPVDGLGKAFVDPIPIGDQHPAKAPEHLPRHCPGPRGCEGKGEFVLIAIDGPEVARL